MSVSATPGIDPVVVAPEARTDLVEYCRRRYTHCTVVSDERTWEVSGKVIAEALESAGVRVGTVLLSGDEVVADERFLTNGFVQASIDTDAFIAAGSGTITDITRFISHRMRRAFISAPTAASVDGYTSKGSPLVVRGVKKSIYSHAPEALFADSNVLRDAPHELTAAGFGDIIGKITSIADWRLGRLVWEEPYDEAIAERTLETVRQSVETRHGIGRGEEAGILTLMNALIESGLCMLDFGASRPASGAEHHISHFWEMQLLRYGKPGILHGAKVGVATVMVCRLYERVRSLDAAEVKRHLESTTPATFEEECSVIHSAYGALAGDVIEAHRPLLGLAGDVLDGIRERIVANWESIRTLADEVPSAETVRGYLRDAGAPTEPSEIGLSPELAQQGLLSGHFLRDRFTVAKLVRVLGLNPG